MSRTPIYRRWSAMKARCYNPGSTYYHRYGGRGITVCAAWRDSFTAFWSWAQENGYQPHLQLDRIDNDGDYEPSNCRWADRSTNGRNTGRAQILTAFGETKNILAWAEDPRASVSWSAMRKRIQLGWPPEDVVALAAGARRRPPRSPKTSCDRGHLMTPENTILTKRGARECRTCRRAASARYKARIRAKESPCTSNPKSPSPPG